jgi:dihydroorotase
VLGVDLNALVAAATAAPARAIRRPSLGTLAVGTEGDATIVDIEQGAFEFHETQGEGLAADRRFRLKGMVVGGKWWPTAGGDTEPPVHGRAARAGHPHTKQEWQLESMTIAT